MAATEPSTIMYFRTTVHGDDALVFSVDEERAMKLTDADLASRYATAKEMRRFAQRDVKYMRDMALNNPKGFGHVLTFFAVDIEMRLNMVIRILIDEMDRRAEESPYI
jgi:hypothetical protein